MRMSSLDAPQGGVTRSDVLEKGVREVSTQYRRNIGGCPGSRWFLGGKRLLEEGGTGSEAPWGGSSGCVLFQGPY